MTHLTHRSMTHHTELTHCSTTQDAKTVLIAEAKLAIFCEFDVMVARNDMATIAYDLFSGVQYNNSHHRAYYCKQSSKWRDIFSVRAKGVSRGIPP